LVAIGRGCLLGIKCPRRENSAQTRNRKASIKQVSACPWVSSLIAIISTIEIVYPLGCCTLQGIISFSDKYPARRIVAYCEYSRFSF
jgi:hypothetical protein